MSTRVRKPRVLRRKPQSRTAKGSAVSQPPRSPKRVIVATDGSIVANAAVNFARLMAERNIWAPEVVTVVEPLPVSVADTMLGSPSPMYQQAIADSTLGMIRRQMRRYGTSGWKLMTEFGRSVPSIVRAAKERGDALIVLGLGRHGKLVRWLGAETAARVARQSSVPVLAVDVRTKRVPHTVLAAIDFGESSIHAAREALALMPDGGRLHLLHVRWAMDGRTGHDTTWERTYDLGVERGFERIVAGFRGDDTVAITTELRMGNVIETTLKVAKEIGADVIALGSHNQNIVDRMVIGFTPGAILRVAHCSVLIAPPTERTG